jgi:hypothetical protein
MLRRILFLVAISRLSAAIVLVNSTAASDVSGASQATIAAPALNVTSGNLLAVFASVVPATMTVTGTARNSYAPLTAYLRGDHRYERQWYYAKNVVGNASLVVTAETQDSVPLSASEDKIVSSIQLSVAATMVKATGDNWLIAVASFKAASLTAIPRHHGHFR